MMVEYFDTISEVINKLKNAEDLKKIRIDNVIAIFSDIKDSTKISYEKNKAEVSDILEFFSKNFIQIHENNGAEFIDLNGDGAIALYSSENKMSAYNAVITLHNIFKINDYNIIISTGMAMDNLLGMKIKNPVLGVDNYIWAGETINIAASISKSIKYKKYSNAKTIGISEKLFKTFPIIEIKNWKKHNITRKDGEKRNVFHSYYYLIN